MAKNSDEALLPTIFSDIPKERALEADKDKIGAEESGKRVIDKTKNSLINVQ
jgi:hypothetical protein